MHLSIKSLVTGAGLVLVMGAVAHAQKNTPVPCKDGTTSTVSGKGACSGHGGVNGEAKAAQEKAANTAKQDRKAAQKSAEKTEKKIEKAEKATTKAAAKTEEKHETKAEEKAEQAAAKMVKCTDGTESKGGRGACSGHGGIAKKAKKSSKKSGK